MTRPITSRQAVFGLGVLSVINLLNYLDRYILAGVMNKVQAAFHLSNAEGGLLATTFMVVYLLASPVGGYLGDRMSRPVLICASVMLWSLATIASGLASSFALLLVARGLTGVGEAGYGTVAPSLISDFFRKDVRGRMLAIFYTAMPLGAAAGFMLGGYMADHHSWQHAFFVGGAPGVVLAIASFFLADPPRGGTEETPVDKVPLKVGLTALARNSHFWFITAGWTLMTFSVGGLSNWMPKFLESERHFTSTDAGKALGVTTVIGGFAGTLVGGALGDWLEKRRPGGGVWLSAIGLMLAAPCMVLAVVTESKDLMLAMLLAAQFFIFLNNGPLMAALLNAVPAGFRAFAVSLNTLLLHLLGDAASPVLIGSVADASSLARAIQVNAVPVFLGGAVLWVLAIRSRSATPASTGPRAV